MDLISVIVPMYNAQPYIERCISSIQKQIYQRIEIIVIDDGSKDHGAEICSRMSKYDSRIRLIRQPNRGVSDARNTGLAAALGKFVVFADADDYVDPDYISTMYDQIKKTGANVAVCSYYREYKASGTRNEVIYEKLLSSEEAITNMLVSADFDSSICCKMCPAELAKKVGFRTEYCLAEDLLFYYHVFSHCRKVSYISHKCYHYVQHAESAMHAPLGKAQINSLNVFEEILGECENDTIKEAVIVKYVSTCFHLLSRRCNRKGTADISVPKLVVKRYRCRIIRSKTAGRKVKLACLISCVSFGLVNWMLRLKHAQG